MDKPKDPRSGSLDSELIPEVMEAARTHLGMDVSFLTEFVGGTKVFREVTGDGTLFDLEAGDTMEVEDSYCYRVVRGELKGIVTDAAIDGAVKDLPVTSSRNIGSYMGVPVKLQDGSLYGTLCVMAKDPRPDLKERDRQFLQALAQLVSGEVERKVTAAEAQRASLERMRAILDSGGPRIVFQPIVNLQTGKVEGVEALSRFREEPYSPPDVWFKQAWEAGVGEELELMAIRSALSADLGDVGYVSVNLSPATLESREFHQLIREFDPERVVIEVTEHSAVHEYSKLLEEVEKVRNLGVRFAVDDLGAGYAGLSHALRLAPEILKLDNFLVTGVDRDRVRQALVFAVSSFAAMTKSRLVAEGVETADTMKTLQTLGIQYGQGFLWGRPSEPPVPAHVPVEGESNLFL